MFLNLEKNENIFEKITTIFFTIRYIKTLIFLFSNLEKALSMYVHLYHRHRVAHVLSNWINFQVVHMQKCHDHREVSVPVDNHQRTVFSCLLESLFKGNHRFLTINVLCAMILIKLHLFYITLVIAPSVKCLHFSITLDHISHVFATGKVKRVLFVINSSVQCLLIFLSSSNFSSLFGWTKTQSQIVKN